jgi:hypothetical protein
MVRPVFCQVFCNPRPRRRCRKPSSRRSKAPSPDPRNGIGWIRNGLSKCKRSESTPDLQLHLEQWPPEEIAILGLLSVSMGRRPTSEEGIRRGASLSRALAKERRRAGLSQAELAARAGVDLDLIRKLEQQVIHSPGFFTVTDLAAAMDMDLSELARRTRRRRILSAG